MRHVEVLELQSRVVIVVVITASGSVSKRVFEFEGGVDPGLVEWARAYLEETVVGRRPSASVLRRAFDDPGLSTRERLFLETVRPAFADVVASATDLYVGGAAGLLGDARGPDLEACQRLLEVLERRAAVLGLLQEALDPDRTVVRVGPELEGEELRGASYVGTTYGLRTARSARRPARAAADGLREGDPLGARCRLRALPARRGRLRGLLMATTQDDYYALLGVPRDASHDEIKRAFRRLARELHPDVSEDPDAGAAVPRRRRGVRGAVRPRAASDVRPVRPRRPPQRRIRADGCRLREPLGRLRGLLRRGALRAGRAAAPPARPAGRTSRPTSRSTSRRQ